MNVLIGQTDNNRFCPRFAPASYGLTRSNTNTQS